MLQQPSWLLCLPLYTPPSTGQMVYQWIQTVMRPLSNPSDPASKTTLCTRTLKALRAVVTDIQEVQVAGVGSSFSTMHMCTHAYAHTRGRILHWSNAFCVFYEEKPTGGCGKKPGHDLLLWFSVLLHPSSRSPQPYRDPVVGYTWSLAVCVMKKIMGNRLHVGQSHNCASSTWENTSDSQI